MRLPADKAGMDFSTLLANVQERRGTGAGIEVASWYAAAIGPCLASTGCQEKFFGLGTEEQWAAEIKSAASRLVYRNAEMEPDGGLVVVEGGQPRPFKGAEGKAKGEFTLASVTEGACMDFTGVATTKSKDRDADVLDPAGAEPDESHPLLWQHLQLCPIGRHVQIIGRGPNQIRSHWAVANTQLGNDAALLVEFKALRLSIGFIPLEFEPLEKSGVKVDLQKDPRLGWYVKRYKWVETSLVSIPSNEDATITAFSRNKLTHPLVKSWAQGLKDLLPDMVRSGWELPHDGHDEPSHTRSAAPPGKAGCGCGKPAAADCACHAQPAPDEDKNAATDGQKPYENEHACRVKEPGQFQEDSFRRVNRKTSSGKMVGLIMGKLKGDKEGKMTLQAIRYPVKDWKADEARKECKKQGGRLEAAAKWLGEIDTKDLTFEENLPPLVTKQTGEVLAHRRGLPSPHLDGSWEEIQACLEDSCRAHMQSHGMRDTYGPHVILGTFDKHAVVASNHDSYYGSGGPKFKVHKIAWKMGNEGPEWDGAPEPVDLILTHSGDSPDGKKGLDLEEAVGLLVKAPKLGKRDRLALKLGEALELSNFVKDAPELKHPTRAAAGRLNALVVDSLTDVKTQNGKPVENQGTNTPGTRSAGGDPVDEIEAFFAELVG